MPVVGDRQERDQAAARRWRRPRSPAPGPRAWALALVVAALVALWTAPAAAICPPGDVVNERFEAAQRLYFEQLYDESLSLLQPLVEEGCFSDERSRFLSRLVLGLGAFELGRRRLAEQHMLAMLRIDPDTEIDASYASTQALEMIESVRRAHREELDQIRDERGLDTGRYLPYRTWVIIETRRNVYWVNFLPFGAGAFQNGDVGWGTFFAISQGLTLGLNVTSALMVEAIRGSTNTFSSQEAALARVWQRTQLISVSAFLGFYAWGVIDGLLGYEPVSSSTLRQTRESPFDERASLDWWAAPLLGPDHLGVGFGLTF